MEASRVQPSGMVIFAGVMFLVVGAFNVIDGLVALLNADYFADDLLFADVEAWGVLMLIIGAIAFLVGLAILNRSRVGQVLGIALAAFNAIVQLAYIRHFPAWSIIIMVVDALIIWALLAHDAEFS